MATNIENGDNGNVFQNLFAIIKRRFIVIVAVIVLVTLIGTVVAFVKKPSYTAKENMNYLAKSINTPDNTKININAMRDYVDTVVDFCDEEIVLLRADGLFIAWQNSEKTIDEFISSYLAYFESGDFLRNVALGSVSMKEAIATFEQNQGYRNTGEVQEGQKSYFKASMISATTIASSYDSGSSFMFKLSLKDSDSSMARIKMRILSLAIRIESYNAFGGVRTTINETVNRTADISVSTSFSKKSIILLSFFIGIAFAFLVVYVINLFDRTIKDKKEFESLTGANVIAYINEQEA